MTEKRRRPQPDVLLRVPSGTEFLAAIRDTTKRVAELAGLDAATAEQVALGRALSVVPQARYPTCGDLMNALIQAHGLKLTRSSDGPWKLRPLDSTVQELPPPRSKPRLGLNRDLPT